jgi:hypothetical protein
LCCDALLQDIVSTARVVFECSGFIPAMFAGNVLGCFVVRFAVAFGRAISSGA